MTGGRLRAALVIGKRQVMETVLAPGLYVTLALGMVLGFLLVSGFAVSVDSAGFAPAQSGLYAFLTRGMAGVFGDAFVEKLFSEGPYAFALLVAFLPIALFLAISSVFRFAQEKSAGALELLLYGPADGSAYFLAGFLKDVGFSAAALLVLAGFFWLTAGVGNMVLGPLFLLLLPLLLLLSAACSAWGILSSILCSNAAASLAVFLAIMAAFTLMLVGSLSVTADTLRSFASTASVVLQWVSPLFYAALCIGAAEQGSAGGALGAIAHLVVLSAVLLGLSHLAISRRGVRP
jgi:hypothetical protein